MFMRLSAGGWCWRRHGSAWCSRGTSRVCESKPEVRRVSREQVVLETRARKCGRDPLFPDVAAWISSRGGLGPNQLSWAITLLKCTSDIEKRLKKLGHKGETESPSVRKYGSTKCSGATTSYDIRLRLRLSLSQKPADFFLKLKHLHDLKWLCCSFVVCTHDGYTVPPCTHAHTRIQSSLEETNQISFIDWPSVLSRGWFHKHCHIFKNP